MIKLIKVQKNIRDKKILNNINLEFKKSNTYGILGPNGAGKTTLMRIIIQVSQISEGEIIFNGLKKNEIGYMPEQLAMYMDMSVIDYIKLMIGLLKIKINNNELINIIKKLNLENHINYIINTLSKGLKKKVQLLIVFIQNPKFVILDEPFDGLDPVSIETLTQLLFELKKKGVTILLSTHRMDLVNKLVDNIIFINNGNVIEEGLLESIKEKYSENKYIIKTNYKFDDSSIKNNFDNEINTFKIEFSNLDELSETQKKIIQSGCIIKKFDQIDKPLEEIFIEIIKNERNNNNN